MSDKYGKGVPFERIRRITGYLQSLSRFCNAKQAEEKDRVKHGFENVEHCICCGAVIPEGQIVCPNCLLTVKENDDGNETRNGKCAKMPDAIT